MKTYKITFEIKTTADLDEVREVAGVMEVQLEALDDGTLESGKEYPWTLHSTRVDQLKD